MARDTKPRCKKCIAVKERLFLKGERCISDKCPLHKWAGKEKMAKKVSVYSMQLQEKQKAKWIYGIMERQFQRYFQMASKKENPGEALFSILERRLDNVIFRFGFANSRPQARQIVRHGFIKVNEKKTTIPSYLVKVGDEITLDGKMKERIKTLLAARADTGADWFTLDTENLKGRILRLPQAEDVRDIKINTKLIVEFYSK